MMNDDSVSGGSIDPAGANGPAMPGHAPQPVARDFCDAVLAALTEMAVLSLRRQADVGVAVRRAGLKAPPEAIAGAVAQLREEGCVEGVLHLSDGGILLSVTMRGIEYLSHTAFRHVTVPATGFR